MILVLPPGSVTTSINLFRTTPGSVPKSIKYYILKWVKNYLPDEIVLDSSTFDNM